MAAPWIDLRIYCAWKCCPMPDQRPNGWEPDYVTFCGKIVGQAIGAALAAGWRYTDAFWVCPKCAADMERATAAQGPFPWDNPLKQVADSWCGPNW